LDADVAYLTDFLAQTPGPVVAVGHSYGGAVISDAAHRASNVAGLVFVAAFAPDEGEILGQVSASSKDSILMTALVPHLYPVSDGTAVEFFVDPMKFRDVFAVDLSAEHAAVLAATQRPVAAAAFADVVRTPAWRDIPSWAIVATADKAAGTDLVRSMAARAGATTTEVDASHLVLVSRPDVVADVILRAVADVAQREPAGVAG
ncbi:MAG TPA: alpha/beta hydrolase, partial [Candidatus Limnocylindrales bacterium]|nr:alpha/beta hydrolase [Candidatus Limnocylindrales bacterium]